MQRPSRLSHSASDGLVVNGKSSMNNIISQLGSLQESEEFMCQLLSSMPRSQLSSLQRRIAPLLQFDVVGSLPTEVALQIFSHVPPFTLLTCAAVSRRWNVLANDQSLWKALCYARGWEWRQPTRPSVLDTQRGFSNGQRAGVTITDDDDEGMGDSDDEGAAGNAVEDSGFASFSTAGPPPSASSSSYPTAASFSRPRRKTTSIYRSTPVSQIRRSHSAYDRHSAPPSLATTLYDLRPDYKLLFRTHIHLRKRFITSSYRLSVIQTRGSPSNGHENMIYCVQLYTYPQSNKQVIFTGSRDKTIREWNIKTGEVERVFEGEHTESVLSLCVKDGWMVSAGSDWRVVVWNLEGGNPVKVLRDHSDSVLCVRLDDQRLVSCSKDRTVRVYTFPGLELLHVLGGHRAAVNAISLNNDLVVSGSGDRSMNVWDVKTGKLLQTFEDHHTRGIASIDFKSPYIVSGSSDKHIRLIDMNTSRGWSTSPEYDTLPLAPGLGNSSPSLPTAGRSAPLVSHAAGGGVGPFSSEPYSSGRGGGLVTCMCQSCGSIEVQPIGCATSSNSSATSTSTPALTHPSFGLSPPFYTPLSRHLQPSSMLASLYPHHNFHLNHCVLPTYNNRVTTTHTNLVRSVILGPEFIITGSYDLSIKIWCRKTGMLITDLTGGHIGKIFCVAADKTKVVSCGEDMRICVWDFGVGIETGYVKTEW